MARSGRRGSQAVEFGLMMIPFLALVFMTLDGAWALLIKATLQHAVQEGVRYGITGQVSGNLGQIASIKSVVQSKSMKLLTGSQSGTLSVQFLNGTTLLPTASNVGGNLVKVSVTGYKISPLAPLLRSATPISVTITAADKIEGSPGGIPPTP